MDWIRHNNAMEQANNMNPATASSPPPATISSMRSDVNVIESRKKYNQSQIKEVLCIENDTSTLDCDVIRQTTTHENDMPEQPEPAANATTLKESPIVEPLMDYNNELIGIIDKTHSNVDTQAAHNCCRPTALSMASPLTSAAPPMTTDIPNLIDFDDCQQHKPIQSTETPYDEISVQNQKLIAENGALKQKIRDLERQKEGLEEAAVEARVLVFEVAERHDMIVRLKNEINDIEQQLKQKDTHIQFKDEIIKKLRLQRRSYLKCPHDLSRTKLDSIDKVVDLIRTVSRDISPDPATKECNCYIDLYQEKENQTDDELCESIESMHEHARKIEAQQAEIEMLNKELTKKEANYEKVAKILASLQQQLESIKPITMRTTGPDLQVDNNATAEEVSTVIADKTHLANLITSLKSEMASANALLKSKENDYNEAKLQANRFKDDLRDANKRIATLEKQCEQYRQTIKHLEYHLKTYADTIKKLEENQSVLKSITFQYENDLLEELAFKFFDYDGDCLSNGMANIANQTAVVNNIQAKLLRMENAYAKRIKIQGICYKKKLTDFQRTIMELNRQMQTQKNLGKEEILMKMTESEDSERSTLAGLVSQIHHLQQNAREKEMLMKRSEISANFKHDSLMQKITRLEKQVDQEKRLNTNLTAEIESCRRESRLLKESSLTASQDQTKQVIELKRLNDELLDRMEKQADELQRLNAKLNEASLVNRQLNDELNEKTEQICHLHSENSRLTIEITKLISEMKNGQENESQLSLQLVSERKNTDSTSKSLSKCEALLKKFSEKNEQIGRENSALADNVVDLKQHLSSLTEILKDTQHNLRISNDKVQHLTMYQHKFVEIKKAHDSLQQKIAEKSANQNTLEANLIKLQNAYDSLLMDFNNLNDLKGKAEHTLNTANEWQREQSRRDELINKKITMQEEHISTLLEDRNVLIAKNQEMLRDMFILKEKLEDYKFAMPRGNKIYLGAPIFRYRSDPQINDWEDYQQRLDNSVERITKHLHRTRTFWENGITKAIQKTVIKSSPKPEDSAIDEDSIEGSPRADSTN